MNSITHPRVRIMGILNVTPDSFSDGGAYSDPRAAIAHGLCMAHDGASIIDIGAESTRPGSTGVAPHIQLAKLLPVLKAIRAASAVGISIDTRSAEVASACLKEGATMINDVSALRHDPGMAQVLAKHSCPIVLMHMLGTPETMQQNPVYADVVREIIAFFNGRIVACEQAGIARSRIWLDPGIGFGKTFEHNLQIVRNFDALAVLGQPLLAGVSRKGFIGELAGERDPRHRDSASLAAGIVLVTKGAAVLRVHDVAGHVSAFKALESLECL